MVGSFGLKAESGSPISCIDLSIVGPKLSLQARVEQSKQSVLPVPDSPTEHSASGIYNKLNELKMASYIHNFKQQMFQICYCYEEYLNSHSFMYGMHTIYPRSLIHIHLCMISIMFHNSWSWESTQSKLLYIFKYNVPHIHLYMTKTISLSLW